MWNEAKLDHLLLLGPFRMLEVWCAWTLIMIFWYLLEMAWVCTWKAWASVMIFRYLLEMAWTLIMIFWKAWTLIMMKWLGLALGRHASCELWPLMLIMRIHLWWAQVVGLEWFKKQFLVSIKSRVQSQAFGHEFIHSIQGSNNYDGPSVGLGLLMVQTMAKHMHNAMQFTWTNLKIGSMGHYNMGRR